MTLNKLSKNPKGQKQLEMLIQEFKSENSAIQPEETGMFKKGGKLDYLINRFKSGGKLTVKSTLDYAPGYTSRPAGMDMQKYFQMDIKQYSDLVKTEQ